MEDFRLKVFGTVVQEGSFTKAASVLGITQPAVSQNIAELEKITGTRLFERHRAEAVLTASGMMFKEYADRICSGYSALTSMYTDLGERVVKISASEEIYSYMVKPLLEKFGRLHDGITFVRVLYDEADLVISLAPSPDSPFDIYPETIAKVRVSMSPAPKKLGDFAATQERTSYFDVLFKPTATFAETKVCRLLKDYFASLL